jgi:hypothetical protein
MIHRQISPHAAGGIAGPNGGPVHGDRYPMVSRDVADLLISVISCESETLSNLARTFETSCAKADQLCILTSLSCLLMDDILDPSQQIISAWLLRSCFARHPIRESPFCSVFQFILQSGSSGANSFSQKLCDIASCFLSDVKLDDLGDHSVHEILDHTFAIDCPTGPEMLHVPLAPLARISPVVVSKADPSGCEITQHQLLRELLLDPALWTEFEVPFSRLAPEIAPPAADELQFMHISSIDAPPYLFDQGASLNPHETAKFFIAQSAEAPLRPWETALVLEELRARPNLVAELNLKRPFIARVLELNPSVGAVFMLELVRGDPSMFPALERGDITPQSVGVVREVVLHLPYPRDFLDNYIGNASQVLARLQNQHALAAKAGIFCSLIAQLHENKVAFSGKAQLDLHSLAIELAGKGIPEAAALSALLN